MSDTPKIYTSLCAISKEIGAIGKDKKNLQQNFMFRGIDQVMNALHPLLVEFGVFIVPEILESHREERQTKSGGNLIYTIHKIKYHFTAMDGSEVCATVIGEGMDSADKSSNKAMAIAFKYACFQMFCIPTEEMAEDDPDNYTPETSKRQTNPQQPQKSMRERIIAYLKKMDEKTRKDYMDYFQITNINDITDELANEIAEFERNKPKK